MFGQGVIVGLVKAAHHALFFGTLETGDPFLPYGGREKGFAVELDDARLPEPGFDVGFCLVALVAAFEQFAHEVAEDLAVAVGSDPDLFEVAKGKEGAEGAYIFFT